MFQYRFFIKVQLHKLKLNWKHTQKKKKEKHASIYSIDLK